MNQFVQFENKKNDFQKPKNQQLSIRNINIDKENVTIFTSKVNGKNYAIVNVKDTAVFVPPKWVHLNQTQKTYSVGLVDDWDYGIVGVQDQRIKGKQLVELFFDKNFK